MGKIFCLLGQTSSGKTTVENGLLNEMSDFHSLPSTTTRPMRDYEKQFDPYNFTLEEEFFDFIRDGKLAEYTAYHVDNGDVWFYGTLKKDVTLERNCIKVINPKGYMELRNYYGEDNVIGIYIRCDEKERLLRSIHREKKPNCPEICRRFLSDKNDFKGIEKKVDYIAENNKSLEQTIAEIKSFILSKIH